MNTKLRNIAKNEFKKDFFKLMNSSVFGKTVKCTKHKNIKLITVERRRNYLVLEASYNTTKFIMNRNESNKRSHINKSVYFVLPISKIKKIAIYVLV